MFLLHSQRKLDLQSKVNRLTCRQMQIAQSYEKATQETADFQQYMNSAKQLTNAAFQSFGSQAIGQALTSAFGNQDKVNQVMSGNMSGLTQEEVTKAQTAVQMGQQAAQQAMYSMQAVTGSIFDSINNAKLKTLQVKEQNLLQEKESIETQIKQLKANYDVEKNAEASSIKDASVGYGLA